MLSNKSGNTTDSSWKITKLMAVIAAAMLIFACVFLFAGAPHSHNKKTGGAQDAAMLNAADADVNTENQSEENIAEENIAEESDAKTVSDQKESHDLPTAEQQSVEQSENVEEAQSDEPEAEENEYVTSLNDEFGINPNTVEDYSANLDKTYFGYYDSGITDFSFRYPLYLYNDVTRNEEPFKNDYGTNEVTYTFTGSNGSRLIYSLTKRNDYRSIRDMSSYVYSNETNILIDSSDIVNSVTDDHGKVIVTGWEDTTKDYIIYDMTKIEEDYVLQMKVFMTDFDDTADKNMKSYVTECDYRYCGFSDTKYAARTYDEFLEAN